MAVVIIDYGMGNLASVQHSITLCGGDAVVSQNPDDLKTASGIILPGVGAFGDAMAHLHKNAWVEALRTEAVSNKIPFLGVCLGMQLLADSGSEGKAAGEEATPGLGFIAGDTVRMEPHDTTEKIPHVGWNEVHQSKSHWIFDGIDIIEIIDYTLAPPLNGDHSHGQHHDPQP
jgi:glutamine amidotransferase